MRTHVTLYQTRNSGQYERGSYGSLTACRRWVRAAAGCRLHWREEGGELAAYKSKADMADEDKAYARIRSVRWVIGGAK